MEIRKLTPEEVEAKLGSGLVIFGGKRPSSSAASSATAASKTANPHNPMQEAGDANVWALRHAGLISPATNSPDPDPKTANTQNVMQEAEDANITWFKRTGMKPFGTARPEPTASEPPAGTSVKEVAAP